MAFTGIITDLH